MRKHDRAVVVPVAREAGIESDVVKWQLWLGTHKRRKIRCCHLQRRVAFCRNDNRHIVNIGWTRHFSLRAVVTFEDDVRICAPETERVGANNQLTILLKRRVFAGNFDIPFVEVNIRVRILNADGGRHDAMLDAMQSLHQARNA